MSTVFDRYIEVKLNFQHIGIPQDIIVVGVAFTAS